MPYFEKVLNYTKMSEKLYENLSNLKLEYK